MYLALTYLVLRLPFRSKKSNVSSDNYLLGSSEHFEWRALARSSSVSNVDWIKRRGISYLEKVYSIYKNDILKLGDANKLPIRVSLKPSFDCQGGISGATSNGELTYCAGEWASNGFCYGILAHELCNLFTGERVSPGWPEAWWANHRSPFPTVIANKAIQKIVPEHYKMWGDYSDPLVLMFDKIYTEHANIFPKMFQKMRELGLVLSRYGEPELSHILYYFMFYASSTKDISNYFVSPPMPPINPSTISLLEGRFNLGIVKEGF